MAIINNFNSVISTGNTSPTDPPNNNTPTNGSSANGGSTNGGSVNGSSADNPTTFKIGNKSYKILDLINFDMDNYNHFYNYARDFAGFTSAEDSTALRGAILDAINHAVKGGSFDANYSHGDVKNHITKGGIEQGLVGPGSMLSRFIYGFTKNATPVEEEKKDFTNYTLGAYLKGIGQDAEYIFSNYDKTQDENVIDGREFNERGKLTYDILKGYKNFLEPKKFNFADDENPYNDNYMTVLDNAIKMFENETGAYNFNKDNFDIRTLTLYLNYLGSDLGEGYNYTRALTSDKYKDLTDEEKAKIASDKKAKEDKEAEKAAAELKRNQQNFYNTLKTNWFNKMSQDSNFSGIRYFFNSVDPENKYYKQDIKDITADQWTTAYYDLLNSLLYDTLYTTNINKEYIMPYWISNNPTHFEDLGDDQYLIKESLDSENNGWALVYDKKGNDFYWEFMGNPKYAEYADITNTLKNFFNNYVKSRYTNDPNNPNNNLIYDQYYNPNLFPTDYQGSFKQGGNLIKKYQYGKNVRPISSGYSEKTDEETAEKTKERAKKNNISNEEQAELDRDFLNTFNWNDIIQLGTIAGNLGSMFLGPLSGALVGAGMTIADFFNDWNRDGLQWRDAKNLITGLGMDAIGMIPVVGDSFGTMGKVTRSLVLYVPKIIGYIGTAGSLYNTPELIKSLKKVGNEKLTVQDWKNVANAVNLVVTGARGTKNTIYSARAKHVSLSKPKDGDNFKLQIEIVNKNDKKKDKKLLILEGEDAKNALSNPTQENINKILKQPKYKDLEGYEAVPESILSGVKIRAPWKKIDDPADPDKKVRAGFSGMVDYETPSVKIQPYYDPIKFTRNYSDRLKEIKRLMLLEPNHGYNGKNVYDYSLVGLWRRDLKNKLKKQENDLLRSSTSLRKLKSDLADVKREIKSTEKENNRVNKKMSKRSKELSRIEKRLESLKDKDKIELNGLYKSKKDIETQLKSPINKLAKNDLEKRKKIIEEKIRNLENKSYKNYEDEMSNIRNTINILDENYLKNLTRIRELEYKEGQLSSSKKDLYSLYKDLLKLEIEGENPEGDLEVFKSQYYNNLPAIKRYYNSLKQGGSIDRNKLNKYLNYAKG